MNVRIRFLGGARSVTGSKYLLEIDDYRLLIDCGLFQGLRELRRRNWDALPIPPQDIDAVVLTHAHIDHSGYLPRLVDQGFHGPIYCTLPTKDLVEILLLDSARLQEEEALFAKRKGYSRHENPAPLYGVREAEKVLPLLRPFGYNQSISIKDDIRIVFNDAGHILGSAIVEVFLKGNTQHKKVVFSGDLGRYDQPVFYNPTPIKDADVLLIESTYGDKEVLEEDVMAEMANIIHETVDNGGKLIIPAFAVGRTQTVIYYLYELMTQGRIPALPIYIDSPMAINVTDLYKHFPTCHKLRNGRVDSIFDYKQLKYRRTKKTSKLLNELKGSSIIVSASGMATGGRILHHLYHHLPNPKDTVLFVGFQAHGTRGRRLLEGEPMVKIFGQDVPVRCNIRQLHGLSAHANRAELFRWLYNFSDAPKYTYIIHGEPESATAFAQAIKERLGWYNVVVPDYLDSETLFWHI
jgi:metallo-beta-lactamase family protein